MRDSFGTPLSSNSLKIMLLGCGELGKEVIIEAQKLGIETVGVDRYSNAPGQQAAHKAYTIDMMDPGALTSVIMRERPDAIVPEIEAINLDVLEKLEHEGFFVVPNARATRAAMHRERIRELISKEAGVPTSRYEYASTGDPKAVRDAIERIGYPCWVKAIMSSSGHGSSFVKGPEDVEKAIAFAREDARGSGEKVIIEEHIPFDIELTELAVRHYSDQDKIVTSFPKPVGHYQIDSDYHSSWQPWLDANSTVNGKQITPELLDLAEKRVYEAAGKITGALGGTGIFGCELYAKFDIDKNDVNVYGNECSARPHDTGMVTFVTHLNGLSQAGLHLRAICGLPIPSTEWNGFRVIEPVAKGASHVILSSAKGWDPEFRNIFKGMLVPGTSLRFFGKPYARTHRRMGVALTVDESVEDAKTKAETLAHGIEIRTSESPEWKKQDIFKKHIVHKD